MVTSSVKIARVLPMLAAQIRGELRDGLQKASWLVPSSLQDWLARTGDCLPGTLMILAGRIGQGAQDALLPAAVSMEMLCMAQHLPQGAYREFLSSRAFSTIIGLPEYARQAFADLIAGWAMEGLREEKRGWDLSVTEEQYLEHVYTRSGLLHATCCQLGARLGTCTAEIVEALTTYGFALGMALQIRQDMSPSALSRGMLSSGLLPLPVIHSLRHSEQTRLLLTSAKQGQVPLRSLTRCLQKTGSLVYADSVTETYIKKAKASLSVLPASNLKAALLDLLSAIPVRTGKEW